MPGKIPRSRSKSKAFKEDTTLIKELLLASIPLERVVELFRGRVDEQDVNLLARRMFSEKNKTENNTTTALTNLGKCILERSKSASNDEVFMDDFLSHLTKEAPDEFLDPIMLTVMKDPVVLSSGFVVDRDTIVDKETGLLKFSHCPWSRQQLKEAVYPLVGLKKKLAEFKETKIRPMLAAAGKCAENKKLEEFIRIQALAKDFIDSLGDATYANYEKKVAELNIKTWSDAGAVGSKLWSPEMLADNFCRIYKATTELHGNDDASKDVAKKRNEFVQRVSILEESAIKAISKDQLDVASAWCDACELVNQSCTSVSNIPVSRIRLAIGKKRGDEHLKSLQIRVYLEIQNDAEAAKTFCEDEGINEDEFKAYAHLPVGISIKSGWFINSVTFAYQDGTKRCVGGSGGYPGSDITKLDEGEMLVSVEGFNFNDPYYLGSYIRFTTNMNREILVQPSDNPGGYPDNTFSIPDGHEIHQHPHENINLRGYYYRFENPDGIFGLKTKMSIHGCEEIVGIISAEEHLTTVNERLPDGEYKIQNAYKGVLFCSDEVLRGGNIWPLVSAHPGYENGDQERWHIQCQPDGNYKIRNKKHGGPLFAGDNLNLGPSEQNDQNHWAWVEPNPDYSNNGKELWSIEHQADGTYKLTNGKWNAGPLFCSNYTNPDGHYKPKTIMDSNYEDEGKERWIFEMISPVPLRTRDDIIASAFGQGNGNEFYDSDSDGSSHDSDAD